MRILIILICLCFFCINLKTKAQSETSKTAIKNLQNEIKQISNELENLEFKGIHYTVDVFASKINEFNTQRALLNNKIEALWSKVSETINCEMIICSDFEDLCCFIGNWGIQNVKNGIVDITNNCSYNGSSSLFISAPYYSENKYNVNPVVVKGYVNGVEASTIYKIRYWAKYSGKSDKGNGALLNIATQQDGEWLEHFDEGRSDGKYYEKDWTLYSFQIATITSSPLELVFHTNLENVCIDDIHIVKMKD